MQVVGKCRCHKPRELPSFSVTALRTLIRPLSLIVIAGCADMLAGCVATSGRGEPGSQDSIGGVTTREVQIVSLVREGMAYARNTQPLDAEGAFLKAYLLDSNNPAVVENLAEAAIANGRLEDAEIWMQKRALLGTDSKSNRTLPARAALAAHDSVKGFALLRDGIEKAIKARRQQDFTDIEKFLAETEADRADLRATRCALLEAAGDSPGVGDAAAISKVQNTLGLHCSSIPLLEPLVGAGANSTDAVAMYELGVAYAGCERLEEARRMLVFVEAQQSTDLTAEEVATARKLIEFRNSNPSEMFPGTLPNWEHVPAEWPYWMVEIVSGRSQ